MKKYLGALTILGVIAGIVAVALFFATVRHWVGSHTGVSAGSNPVFYNFWSGFGSDLGEVTLVVGVAALYKRYKCQTCWRLAHHQIDGTHYRVCHHHWTDAEEKKLSARHLRKFPHQHERAIRKKAEAAAAASGAAVAPNAPSAPVASSEAPTGS